MGSLESKYYMELDEYRRLCKLLKEPIAKDKYGDTIDYGHFESLKRNPKIEWINYRYQLKKKKL